jgi:hypothetical protein
MYRGPDAKFQGREICYGYNENMMVMYVGPSTNSKSRMTNDNSATT